MGLMGLIGQIRRRGNIIIIISPMGLMGLIGQIRRRESIIT